MFDTLRHSTPFRRLVAGLLLGGIATLGTFATAAAETLVAQTDTGPVEGVVTPTVHQFLGIPYAERPGRCAALAAAAAARAVDDTARRDRHSARRCAQTTSPFGIPSTSEDCLFLNVYTPHRKSVPERDLRRKRPVMVWIHGGAFQVGTAETYDPTKLVADGDVVVVTDQLSARVRSDSSRTRR